jgi:hypothetical protein
VAEYSLGKPNAERILSQFRHKPVYDINGNQYWLEIDPNALQRFFAAWTREDRQAFERLLGSEKVVVRRAS